MTVGMVVRMALLRFIGAQLVGPHERFIMEVNADMYSKEQAKVMADSLSHFFPGRVITLYGRPGGVKFAVRVEDGVQSTGPGRHPGRGKSS